VGADDGPAAEATPMANASPITVAQMAAKSLEVIFAPALLLAGLSSSSVSISLRDD
jgi:hypothetical protein